MAGLEDLPYIKLPLHGKHGEGKFVLVDGDYDGEYFGQYRWLLGSPLKNRKQFVFRGLSAYENDSPKRNHIYLHREVASATEGQFIHFKNGDHLDCRSRNILISKSKGDMLRLQRRAPEYMARQIPRKRPLTDKREAYRGVNRKMGYRDWYVIIKRRDKYTYIGGFTSPESAARKYDELAYKTWGDKAVLNFPLTLYLKKKYQKD
jgi:hypothetical protein